MILPRTLVKQLDTGCRHQVAGPSDALQARGIGDAASFHGHVEIDTQQHAFAFDGDIIEGAELFGHE